MLTFAGLVPAIILFFVYAFHSVGLISIFWCFPAVLAFYFMLPERQAWIANIAFIVMILPQAWMTLEFALAIRLLVSVTMVSIFSAVSIGAATLQLDEDWDNWMKRCDDNLYHAKNAGRNLVMA
ncbi:MAG: hypothetical protein ACN4GR_03735 [Arenicellales bacterium]